MLESLKLMQSGDSLGVKLKKCYDGYMKVYTYEGRNFTIMPTVKFNWLRKQNWTYTQNWRLATPVRASEYTALSSSMFSLFRSL